jgi:hypothetical protein
LPAFSLGALTTFGLVVGCHWFSEPSLARPGATTAPSATIPKPAPPPASAPALIEWDDSAKGIKVKYPADWRPKKNPDFELMLVPIGATVDARRITIDVPDLPPHLPFMIQMGRVEHDYIQDLKKEHPDLRVKDSTEVTLPEGQAKLVRSSWHQKSQTFDDVALLIIHASSVYILDARTDEGNLAITRPVFDQIESSIVWTKGK